jgi:hemolysin III
VANAITHGIGLVLSLAGAWHLIGAATDTGDLCVLAGSAIFALTLVQLYSASTLLHAAEAARRRTHYELVDHCAIYALIGGTYTPLFLVPMAGRLGNAALVIIWTSVFIGMAFKIVCGCNRHVRWSLASYLIAGWLPVLILKEMIERMPPGTVVWLVAGGLFYTVGVPFYLSRRYLYSHAIWHLFVMAGSACHYRAVVCALFPV